MSNICKAKGNNETISISSLGILELNLYLTLKKRELKAFGVKSQYINELADLSSFLSTNNPSLLDRIVLLTNNSLINTLLFINRSFKEKTLMELITTSEVLFPAEHLFFKAIVNYVTDKNLLFIFENRITSIPSSITFTLKIIDDDTEEIEQKYFTIGKQTVPIDQELLSCSVNLFDELTYRFSNDYFICSFEDLLLLKQNDNHAELISFFNLLIKNYPTIHIITLFFGDYLSDKDEGDGFLLDIMKEVIEYSDIVIAEKALLITFYKLFGKKYTNKNYLSNCSLEEAIIQDAFSKKRNEIVKVTLLLDRLKTATIIMQESFSFRVLFNATHSINLSNSRSFELIANVHLELLMTVFIGGFLSRLLHFKTFNTCLVAAGKVVSKVINLILANELETVYNKEEYEVVVHFHSKQRLKDDKIKYSLCPQQKKAFVLDCLNSSESQLKPYNAICDTNCSNFLNSRKKLSFLKAQGFIDKRGALLKDPQLIREPFDKKPLSLAEERNRLVKSGKTGDKHYMNQTWKEQRMGFTQKRQESPCPLPLMNKTHQAFLKSKDNFLQKSGIQRGKGSKEYLDKGKLRQIMLKYEHKASSEIRKFSN